jgi:hypothetical protein
MPRSSLLLATLLTATIFAVSGTPRAEGAVLGMVLLEIGPVTDSGMTPETPAQTAGENTLARQARIFLVWNVRSVDSTSGASEASEFGRRPLTDFAAVLRQVSDFLAERPRGSQFDYSLEKWKNPSLDLELRPPIG